jgi:hypothetical protein
LSLILHVYTWCTFGQVFFFQFCARKKLNNKKELAITIYLFLLINISKLLSAKSLCRISFFYFLRFNYFFISFSCVETKRNLRFLFYWRSSYLASTRQRVHAVETSCLVSFREIRTSNDVLAVICEDTRNHHPKKIVAFGYDTK